jgi:ectoine hydroxylase-related dioxygenase (phytanoyl-CoA dioxygenase family)
MITMILTQDTGNEMNPMNSTYVLENPSEARYIFNNQGVLHIENVFSASLCDSCIASIQEIEEDIHEHLNDKKLVTELIEERPRIKYYQGLYGINSVMNRFFSAHLLSICSALLDDKSAYFSDLEAHIRNPGGTSIPKHQDNFYFNLQSAMGMTCYVALNPQDGNEGALKYILGSHIKRVLQHQPSSELGFSSYLSDKCIDNAISINNIYSPKYQAGSVTIHHPENIHFADPCPINNSRKYALSVRVFSGNEIVDEEGVKRYKRLLEKNRR